MELWTGALSSWKCHWLDLEKCLASSLEISSWTPLKPQHSNPNPKPLTNQLWVYWLPYSSHTSHHQTTCLPWISYATQKLMLYSCKMVEKQSGAFHTFVSVAFFPSLKQNFIAYCSSKVSDCIFEIHQLWQSGFSRVYSNWCCSCWFEPEIIKIVSHLIRCITITYWIFKKNWKN